MFLILLFTSLLARAQVVGEVTQGDGIQALRNGQSLVLKVGDEIQLGDSLTSKNSQILLSPSNQFNLDGRVKIQKVSSQETELDLEDGHIHIQVDSEEQKQLFRLKTPMAAFGVRGTEFEVNSTEEEVELQVFEGVVEADDLAGNIQAVKPKEAFGRKKSERGWHKREFKFKRAKLSFLKKDLARRKWKKKKPVLKKRR